MTASEMERVKGQKVATGHLESRFAEVDGVRMHARVSVAPVPEGHFPIILVHGLIISSLYMVPLGERLAPDYPVYAPDLPGYGESGEPGWVLTLPELANALCRWMDVTGIERAAMLGNSFGCQVVAEFGMRYPDRLAKAILAGPSVDRHARNLPSQALRLLINSRLERSPIGWIHMRDYRAAGLRRIVETIRIAMADAIEMKLPHMTAPTLVVRGDRDLVVPHRWAAEVTRLLPNGHLAVIPGEGHALNFSAPLALSRVTRAFLNAPDPCKQQGEYREEDARLQADGGPAVHERM